MQIPHLESQASPEESALHLGQPVSAEVELPQAAQVAELPGAEDRVVIVSEQVPAQPDHLQGVLHAVEQTLVQAAHLSEHK